VDAIVEGGSVIRIVWNKLWWKTVYFIPLER